MAIIIVIEQERLVNVLKLCRVCSVMRPLFLVWRVCQRVTSVIELLNIWRRNAGKEHSINRLIQEQLKIVHGHVSKNILKKKGPNKCSSCVCIMPENIQCNFWWERLIPLLTTAHKRIWRFFWNRFLQFYGPFTASQHIWIARQSQNV